MRRSIASLAVAATQLFAACYTYVPRRAGDEFQPSGATYRGELSDSGTVALASQVGPGVYKFEGRLAAVTPAALTFSLLTTTSRRLNTEQLWAGERVTMDRPLLTGLEEQRLSKPRTAGFVVLAVGAVLGAYAAFKNNQAGNPTSRPPGGVQ